MKSLVTAAAMLALMASPPVASADVAADAIMIVYGAKDGTQMPENEMYQASVLKRIFDRAYSLEASMRLKTPVAGVTEHTARISAVEKDKCQIAIETSVVAGATEVNRDTQATVLMAH
ncbi:hypothetical protein GJW-30_1_01081 [Variibacter gotjawalensis]|uniref:Uncharacterized protein n=1 Tax=Variibacter gotjawalensis TaxID=1333996 RepID=A0A0S3PRH3_9BRAD|nr:hypothetical protein [Variibacter gotjawalensis]NIK48861.1 hypothetical protein [Variibacter gotjawalensis]RZS50719.1 hypothetical protein EV661_3188 [Variibacter gotjawalensis]BAT58555.1 hypothetical protein GJW-30_1_01081 [Variibacter gotjawalensis]